MVEELNDRMRDFDGQKADLTNDSVRKFLVNTIALRVYDTLGYDDPATHTLIHLSVTQALKDLATAEVRISE